MADPHVHVTPLRTYLAVAGALFVLTVVTVAVSFVDFGAWNVTIALAIASVKALLVAFFFMHLFWDNKIYLIVFGISLIFLTIFLTFTMFDTVNRGTISEETGRPIQSEAPMYEERNK